MRPACANDDSLVERHETLALLPDLLGLARAAIAALEGGDPEIESLRALLDECVVGAHRIRLREQLAAGQALTGRG